MSQFKKNSAIGKAGEHYFAYWLMSQAGWPCRLLDLDIGIDAQVEILDHKQHSTGDFIGIQVKTTATSVPIKTVYKKHLEYWNELDDEVIYISISDALKDSPKIYWKHLNNSIIERLLLNIKEKKTNSVELDLGDSDILHSDNIENLAQLKYINHRDEFIAHASRLNVTFTALSQFFDYKNYHVGDTCFEKWIIKSDLDETAIHGVLSTADGFFRYLDIIDDIQKYCPKISNVTNTHIDEAMRPHVDEMVIALVKHIEFEQEEILSDWSKANPNSKVSEFFNK